MLKQFTAQSSNFRGTDGKKVPFGNWWPTYYKYVVQDKIQYLLVSDQPEAGLKGVRYTLDLVPTGVNIKSMASLEKPGTYAVIHKYLS